MPVGDYETPQERWLGGDFYGHQLARAKNNFRKAIALLKEEKVTIDELNAARAETYSFGHAKAWYFTGRTENVEFRFEPLDPETGETQRPQTYKRDEMYPDPELTEKFYETIRSVPIPRGDEKTREYIDSFFLEGRKKETTKQETEISTRREGMRNV